MGEPEVADAVHERRRARGLELLAEEGRLWSALPVEWPRAAAEAAALPGWGWRVWRSLVALLVRPQRSFSYVQEPVDHAAVLRLLLTVRLPAWALLLLALAWRWALWGGGEAVGGGLLVLDARLVKVLSLWLLLMVPVGVPLTYFVVGIATHVALALSGVAPRSIAATMRAVGFALAPALLAVGLLDLPLFLGKLPLFGYLGALAALSLLVFWQAGHALTGTHQLPAVRGFAVALVPAAMFAAGQALRAVLALGELPGYTPPPGLPYLAP
ncbi:MAG TPA: hypothetical protein VIK91_05445 [Nannocystis sp.]